MYYCSIRGGRVDPPSNMEAFLLVSTRPLFDLKHLHFSSETTFLAKSLAELCATQPGKYPPMIAAALADRPSGQKTLQGYLAQAGVTLV